MKIKLTIGLLAAALFSQTASSAGYLVFGDSQTVMTMGEDTNATDVWPHIVQEATGVLFQNFGRGGRKLATGDIAAYLETADIRGSGQTKGIIIALGTNDRWYNTDIEPALVKTIAVAQQRGLQVVCILPPDNLYFMKGIVSMDVQRSQLRAHCPRYIDATEFIDPWELPDGVHFSRAQHRAMASNIIRWFTDQGEL
jgi:lysophospholipase L1-like esterase